MPSVTVMTPDPIVEKLLSLLAAQLPEEPEQMMQLLDRVDGLVGTIPCYRLRCDMTENSVLAAYQTTR